MSEINYRKERIERLLKELQYEVTRGIMDGDIPETMSFQFFIGISRAIPDGVVNCRFATRPVPRYQMIGQEPDLANPRLRLVKGGDDAG